MPNFLISGFSSAVIFVLASITAHARGPIPHQWSNAAKESVGTAVDAIESPVWFTTGSGILNEIYYPRIDQAQVGDSQLLFVVPNAAGQTKFFEEKRNFKYELYYPTKPSQLGNLRIPRPIQKSVAGTGADRIVFTKEIVSDRDNPVLRIRYVFQTLPKDTKIFLLHKPAVDNDGAGDIGRVITDTSKTANHIRGLLAFENGYSQFVTASGEISHASIGVVGDTDGWQDIYRNRKMTLEIPANGPANIALTAEIEAKPIIEIAIGFGITNDSAIAAVTKSTAKSMADLVATYDTAWNNYLQQRAAASFLKKLPSDLALDLVWNSAVIKTHEDRENHGAIVAGLSIPSIPDTAGAGDGKYTGGYHLVWTRDLFKSAIAMLRMGDQKTALNALLFMSRSEHDGRMAQNSWVNGQPFWRGHQMDQEAFPILLAIELKRAGVEIPSSLFNFLNRRKQILLSSNGYTDQERWEETSGFSPNTMAVMAAALAGVGEKSAATKILQTALQKSVSYNGPLSDDPYFIRISRNGTPDNGDMIQIANGGPLVPENKVLDGGFIEWVRWFPHPEQYFGKLGETLNDVLENTIRLYDDPANHAAGRITTSSHLGLLLFGRYAFDAYGYAGKAGPWPILTAERALYAMRENAAMGIKGLREVRALWGTGDLCPEQLGTNLQPMNFAATPLVWCHAEMIELANLYNLKIRR